MEFLSLAIVGAFVSVLVSMVKHYAGTSGKSTQGVVILLSAVGATLYYFAKDSSWWKNIIEIIGLANGLYIVLLQFFDDKIKALIKADTEQ